MVICHYSDYAVVEPLFLHVVTSFSACDTYCSVALTVTLLYTSVLYATLQLLFYNVTNLLLMISILYNYMSIAVLEGILNTW